jgi:MoxR-like ATPase
VDISQFRDLCARIRRAVGAAVIGKDRVIDELLMGVLSDGHVLIEDVPGLAKTLLANSLARAVDLTFRRIQFTPDLLPADIIGGNVFNQRERTFDFVPGPVFANLLLADEVNRATPKTQSALLEAMQERQITVDGKRYPLEPPFLVVATQNPIELEGTYPLPEAQLDRFIMRISVGYPEAEDELAILLRREERKADAVEIPRAATREEFMALQRHLEDVYVAPDVARYMVEIVRRTRRDPAVQVGASPRGSLALFKLSRAAAALDGRDFVTPEDVKRIAVIALAHRIILTAEQWAHGGRESAVVQAILDDVPTPSAEAARRKG